jgi:hypothetical protein
MTHTYMCVCMYLVINLTVGDQCYQIKSEFHCEVGVNTGPTITQQHFV